MFFHDLFELQKSIDQFFTDENERRNEFSSTRYPSLNLFEYENALVVKTELPGVDKKDINIDLKENILTITGKREISNDWKGTWHRRERNEGSFKRQMELPYKVDPERTRARMENGVLTLELERAEEKKGRQISIL